MSHKLTGKQLYIYIFLFQILAVVPIILFAMYIENITLMYIGIVLFFIGFILAVISVFKSMYDKNINFCPTRSNFKLPVSSCCILKLFFSHRNYQVVKT